MKIIEAFGLQCPKPLMLAKKELAGGCGCFAVRVDNETAVKNLLRLAEKSSLPSDASAIEGGWIVRFGEDGENPNQEEASWEKTHFPTSSCGPNGCGYAVFLGKDAIGAGEGQLGYNLAKMALYTLSESDEVPSSLLLMNSGVKLAASEEHQVVENIEKLIDRGTEVLVCGTCLDFYGIKDQLKVGEISNMYDILSRMQEAAKVITL